MARHGDRGEDRTEGRVAATVDTTARDQRLGSINTQIAATQAATTEFEKQQRAFESQIAALARPADPSQFGQAAPNLSFTPGDFAGPSFDRAPIQGVGLTTALAASSRSGSPTAAFTLSNIQERFGGGGQRSVPRGTPKEVTTRKSGTTTVKPEGANGPIQRVLGERQRTRLGGQGKF